MCKQLEGTAQQTLCPLLLERCSGDAKQSAVLRPLFPRYVFARFDMSAAGFAVLHKPGVHSIVSAGADPIPVSDQIIAEIEKRCPEGIAQIQPPSLTSGEKVEIINGPLRGLRGIFDGYRSAGQRVVILLESIKTAAVFRVELSRDRVVAAN